MDRYKENGNIREKVRGDFKSETHITEVIKMVLLTASSSRNNTYIRVCAGVLN
jgi:hypothetical protein